MSLDKERRERNLKRRPRNLKTCYQRKFVPLSPPLYLPQHSPAITKVMRCLSLLGPTHLSSPTTPTIAINPAPSDLTKCLAAQNKQHLQLAFSIGLQQCFEESRPSKIHYLPTYSHSTFSIYMSFSND